MLEELDATIDESETILRMLEVAYIEKNGLEVTDEKCDDLFPNDWHIDKNNEEKIEILVAAIDKDLLIIDTDEYQEYKGEFYISH